LGACLLILASLAFPPDPGDDPLVNTQVVVNEFMATPSASASEAEGEWIELYNRSDDWVNLSGWRVENQSGASVVLGSYLLPPGGYYVLGTSSNYSRNGGYEPDFVYGTSFRISSTGMLRLLNPLYQTAETIDYDSTWPIATSRSCERINPGWICSISASWASAIDSFGQGDLGTPGEVNSVFQNSFAENTWAFIKAFVQ
jgi:uncharacterized protein